MSTYIIEDTTLASIGNAIRNQWHISDTFTPAEMAAKINATPLGMNVKVGSNIHINSTTGKWERPSTWPDLDAILEPIEANTSDFVVMTYDLTCHPDYHWIGYSAHLGTGNAWYLARLLPDENAENGWITGTTFTCSSGDMIRYDLTEETDDANVQVWVLWSNGHIDYCGFIPNTSTTANNYYNNMQPCVERAGYLPWCYNWGRDRSMNYNYRCGSTMWMERDALVPGKYADVTTLANAWAHSYNLREIDFSEWDTSGWHVTNLLNVFGSCPLLKSLDLSKWDTDDWTVGSFSYAFTGCYSLEELDLSSWNTENWAVTTLNSTWQGCSSLKKLDVSTWDTSNWAVTSLQNTWFNCQSLLELDLNHWSTSDWAVTTLSSTWSTCISLQKLNIKDWETDNWPVTTIADAWNSCFSLKKLELNDWDTSGWTVTTLSNTWYSCASLEELNVEDWDTSSWAVTSLNQTWGQCFSLKTFEPAEWNTSNWAVTTLYYTWRSNICLEELDLTGWDTSKWAITSLSNTWRRCYNLKSLDIHNWDTSSWVVTNTSGMFSDNNNLEELLTPASIGIKSSQTSSVSEVPLGYRLKTFSGYAIYVAHNYSSGCYNLTTSSLQSMLNRLPTVSSKTVTLGSYNKIKLSAADIAVATQKGWTVA